MFQPCFNPSIPASVSDLGKVALPARPQGGADPVDHPGGNGGEPAEAAAQLGDVTSATQGNNPGQTRLIVGDYNGLNTVVNSGGLKHWENSHQELKHCEFIISDHQAKS